MLWGILGAIVVIVLGFVFWFELQSHALGSAGKAEIVQISSGETVSSVATQLSDQQVIGSTLAFRLYNVVHSSPSLTPGSYLFHQNQTFGQVAHDFGWRAEYRLGSRWMPGLTLREVAVRVGQLPGHSASTFEQLAVSGSVTSTLSPSGSHNLEGLLGTGTYRVLPGETDTALLTDMVEKFEGQATAAGLSSSSAAALGLTPYQVVTVASVVEKEGYYPKNMPQVARVIYNRLAHQTPLQMDSTILYALGQDGGTVTPQDLKIQNPYNTYLNGGLPPTPICMPSPIAAVGRPACAAGRVDVLRRGRQERDRGVRRHVRRATGQRAAGPCSGGRLTRGRRRRPPGTRCADHRGRGHRLPRPPLTLAPAPQRRVRSAGSQLGLGGFPGRARQVPAALNGMRALGVAGLSVTMPHKAEVAALMDSCSEVATQLQAVNCVLNQGGTLHGANTDGDGFLASLRRAAGFEAVGKRCLVIGAGGAARAVTHALGRAGAADVAVVNRTPNRAGPVAALAGPVGRAVATVDAAQVAQSDLVVNATPLGMAGMAGQRRCGRCCRGISRRERAVAGRPGTPARRSGGDRSGLCPASHTVAGGVGRSWRDDGGRPRDAGAPGGFAVGVVDRTASTGRRHVAGGDGAPLRATARVRAGAVWRSGSLYEYQPSTSTITSMLPPKL